MTTVIDEKELQTIPVYKNNYYSDGSLSLCTNVRRRDGRRDGGTEGRRNGGTEGWRDGGTDGRTDTHSVPLVRNITQNLMTQL